MRLQKTKILSSWLLKRQAIFFLSFLLPSIGLAQPKLFIDGDAQELMNMWVVQWVEPAIKQTQGKGPLEEKEQLPPNESEVVFIFTDYYSGIAKGVPKAERKALEKYWAELEKTEIGKEIVRLTRKNPNIHVHFFYHLPRGKDIFTPYETAEQQEPHRPHDFYGFIHSNGKKAIVALNNGQSEEMGLYSLAHELWHPIDGHPALVNPKEVPKIIRGFISEYRASLVEIELYLQNKARNTRGFKPIPYFENLIRDNKPNYEKLIDFVIDAKHPTRNLQEWLLNLERPPILVWAPEGRWTDAQVFKQTDHNSTSREALMNELLKAYEQASKKSTQPTFLFRAFYRNDSGNREMHQTKNRDEAKTLRQALAKKYGPNWKKTIVEQEGLSTLKPREKGINSHSSGGPKSRNGGNSG